MRAFYIYYLPPDREKKDSPEVQKKAIKDNPRATRYSLHQFENFFNSYGFYEGRIQIVEEEVKVKIEIANKEHFKAAIAFAQKLGKKSKKSFIHSLKIINRIKRNPCNKVDFVSIYPDFVKHSFSWCLLSDERRVMNGGMILHGFEETFSVELNSEKYPHWSIHT